MECGRGIPNTGFGFLNDAGHHADGFDGVIAGSGFGGEHDGVGAVEDGIGDVGSFGAGGARILGHGLQHLRGGDDGPAKVAGARDDVFLNDRNFFRIHFDAEVAAGDHHGIGHTQNLLQIFDGFRLFEFGDDVDFLPRGG